MTWVHVSTKNAVLVTKQIGICIDSCKSLGHILHGQQHAVYWICSKLYCWELLIILKELSQEESADVHKYMSY